MNVLQRAILSAIDRYQRRGGGIGLFRVDCNFEPRCSEYAREAVTRFGAFRGSALALARIRRCTAPDQPGKVADPVPGE